MFCDRHQSLLPVLLTCILFVCGTHAISLTYVNSMKMEWLLLILDTDMIPIVSPIVRTHPTSKFQNQCLPVGIQSLLHHFKAREATPKI